MFTDVSSWDESSRRDFMATTAKSLLGVSLLPVGSALAQEANGGGTAKSVIYLFMSGAMSHLDTLDPKPGVEEQGETEVIRTKVPGIQLANLPKLAKNIQHAAIIRSLGTETGDHSQGRYLMRTSYEVLPSIRHPCMGSWAQRLQGKRNKQLPDSVIVGGGGRHPGCGFMEARYSPLPIGDASAGLQNSQSPGYITDELFGKRMKLMDAFDKSFRTRNTNQEVRAYTEFYSETVKLLKSEELKAFDISQESEKTRERYGDNKFGQGCLLARRLVQNGVRFVEVGSNGWDAHNDIFDTMPDKTPPIDQALDALLSDLQSEGLLQETLVVLATEFGRSPKINQNNGRNHHPPCFSGLLAGGGVKGGQVYGESDKVGQYVENDGVSVADFNATIAHALGLPLEKEVYSKTNRPFTVSNGGKPITKIFS